MSYLQLFFISLAHPATPPEMVHNLVRPHAHFLHTLGL